MEKEINMYNCDYCKHAPNCEFLYETNGTPCGMFEMIVIEVLKK